MYGFYVIFKLFKCNRTLSMVLCPDAIVVLSWHGKWTAMPDEVFCQGEGSSLPRLWKSSAKVMAETVFGMKNRFKMRRILVNHYSKKQK